MKRSFLVAMLVALPGLFGQAPAQAQEKELLLFNWSNYMSPDLLKLLREDLGGAV